MKMFLVLFLWTAFSALRNPLPSVLCIEVQAGKAIYGFMESGDCKYGEWGLDLLCDSVLDQQ